MGKSMVVDYPQAVNNVTLTTAKCCPKTRNTRRQSETKNLQTGDICYAKNNKRKIVDSSPTISPLERYVRTHCETSKDLKKEHVLAYKSAKGTDKVNLRKIVLCDHLHYIVRTVSHHCTKYEIDKGSAEYKELQAVAVEAFLKAMDGYKIEQKATLGTYAKKALKVAMANEYQNRRLISLPNTVRSKIKKVKEARDKLGESASYEELIDECGFNKKTGREKLALLDEVSQNIWSIDYSTEDNDNMSFSDRIKGKTFEDELNENFIEQELCERDLRIKELASDALASLSGRDRYVLIWYYGISLNSLDAYVKLAADADVAEESAFYDYKCGVFQKSFEDISKDFGCTKQACEQRRNKALKRLAKTDWVVEGCKDVSILR